MSWWLHLLVCIVVLYSLPRWGDGALQEQDCQIVSSFSSPYVTPLFQGTANASGCTSQERGTTLSRRKSKSTEVHVIHIGGGEAQSSSGRREVTLHISPLQDSGIYRNSTVFVLRSHQPVTWQIDTSRISNRTRTHLYISDNARIKKNSRVHIKKIKNFPSQRTQLENWVRQHFNGMTSFVEIQHANHIYKKLGYDRYAPRHCFISSNFQSEATSATSMQRNDMSGCAVTENVPNSRDVHILVLKTNARYPVQTATIDIKTKKGVARNRDVVLVLKSDNTRVNWVIKANSVRGRISIITNSEANQVNTHGIFDVSLDISVSGTERNLDMKQGKQLINWVLHSHGPANIISFAETMRANRFEVFIDGGGEKSPWPLYTTLNPESPLPSTVHPAESHQKRGPRPRMSPFDHPMRTKNALNMAQTTTCSPNLVVALHKNILQRFGIRKSYLSLRDRDCKASSNGTHFLLDTQGSNCRTITSESGDRVTLENAVVVHRPDNDDIPFDEEIEGSAIYDHLGSGAYIDDTHIDDEDFIDEEDTIKINVHCITKKKKVPTATLR